MVRPSGRLRRSGPLANRRVGRWAGRLERFDSDTLGRLRNDEVLAGERNVLIGCGRPRWAHACTWGSRSAGEHELLGGVEREADLFGCLDAEALVA